MIILGKRSDLFILTGIVKLLEPTTNRYYLTGSRYLNYNTAKSDWDFVSTRGHFAFDDKEIPKGYLDGYTERVLERALVFEKEKIQIQVVTPRNLIIKLITRDYFYNNIDILRHYLIDKTLQKKVWIDHMKRIDVWLKAAEELEL